MDDKKKPSNTEMNRFDLERGKNLAKGQLDKDTFRVKGDPSMADVSDKPVRVNTGTEKIDTKGVKPIKSGKEFELHNNLRATMKDAIKRGDTETIGKLQQIAKKVGRGITKGAKVIPGIGALAALVGAEDASASVPILDSAESAGMSPEDENQLIAERQAQKDYGQSQAAKDRLTALAKLSKLQG